MQGGTCSTALGEPFLSAAGNPEGGNTLRSNYIIPVSY